MLIKKLEEKNYNNSELLLKEMLLNIGNTNPYFRDKLIYNAFLEMITKDYLTKDQLKKLYNQLLSNQYLLYKIGSKNSDSVYKRSFSALVLGLLINKDKEQQFLEKSQISFLLDRTCFYLVNEQDKRGFTEDKGWAHSIAHCADLLDEIITHPLFEQSMYEKTVEALVFCVNSPFVYEDDEIERLSTPSAVLINRYGFSQEFIHRVENLINVFFTKKTYSHLDTRIISNVRNYLRAIYFKVNLEENKQLLEGCLKRIST
ncbi:hypothetical protein CAR_c22180 [Carnobacterium sp. 17-4]|uniref:DUF2785 domain-containing protein n=1 Tax=Carnobacterium sp. (strain 17-4) TaxID=208596 RepID=UPI00020590A9|nr:DUF2785 domain-containing protein [Carnobacterium sp. 17-4]AEB30875.1 hypothetical protein CAR_c22180 [Carnobacterium sp. 17-4]